jgi:hypothetical protein
MTEASEEEMLEAAAEVAEADDMDVIDELVEELEEESEEASPPEPDEPPDDAPEVEEAAEEPLDDNEPAAEDEPESEDAVSDPEGIVTPASGELYDAMVAIWTGKGSPREFSYKGMQFSIFKDGAGYKFVQTGGAQGVSAYYDSLSVG